LSAWLLREFGSPEEVFRAPLTRLEACRLPAPVAQAVFKKHNLEASPGVSASASQERDASSSIAPRAYPHDNRIVNYHSWKSGRRTFSKLIRQSL
jgi:hypothetical protein